MVYLTFLFLLGLSVLALSVFGAIKAFKASLILGVVSFFVPSAYPVFGLLGLFGKNLPQLIVDFFKKSKV